MPGGTVELFASAWSSAPPAVCDRLGIGETTVSVCGLSLYLRDLVEVTRGYVDPPDVLNYRTIRFHPTARRPSPTPLTKNPQDSKLQTGRAIDLRTAGQGHAHRRLRP
jgi:hypothetical protein